MMKVDVGGVTVKVKVRSGSFFYSRIDFGNNRLVNSL